jgi:hypothetical protein
MKRDLAQAAKWLMGAAVAAILAYVGIVASTTNATLWPFWLFAGIGGFSLILYLRWRNLPMPTAEPPGADSRTVLASHETTINPEPTDHDPDTDKAISGDGVRERSVGINEGEEASETPKGRPYRYDVFISHAHGDHSRIAQVTERLRRGDISYWIDEEQIKFGDQIVSKIEDGLQDSHFVLAALSAALVKSGWCRAEYGPILHREFSGDTSRRVIPLSLDGTADESTVPLLLWDKMRVDFTNEQSFAEFIKFIKHSRS